MIMQSSLQFSMILSTDRKVQINMAKAPNLAIINCRRCNKKITTKLPIISNLQCICADCSTKNEKYQILEEQATKKGLKK